MSKPNQAGAYVPRWRTMREAPGETCVLVRPEGARALHRGMRVLRGTRWEGWVTMNVVSKEAKMNDLWIPVEELMQLPVR